MIPVVKNMIPVVKVVTPSENVLCSEVTLCGVQVRDMDRIVVTGTACSPFGQRYESLPACVATIDEPGQAVKVWPLVDDVPGDGKIWFLFRDITSVELTERGFK